VEQTTATRLNGRKLEQGDRVLLAISG